MIKYSFRPYDYTQGLDSKLASQSLGDTTPCDLMIDNRTVTTIKKSNLETLDKILSDKTTAEMLEDFADEWIDSTVSLRTFFENNLVYLTAITLNPLTPADVLMKIFEYYQRINGNKYILASNPIPENYFHYILRHPNITIELIKHVGLAYTDSEIPNLSVILPTIRNPFTPVEYLLYVDVWDVRSNVIKVLQSRNIRNRLSTYKDAIGWGEYENLPDDYLKKLVEF